MSSEDYVLLEHSQQRLHNVHNSDRCQGRPCTIHNRTDHHMRAWPQSWKADRGLIYYYGIMERICPHGIGHPDPDEWWANDSPMWIHECDGCCSSIML